MSAASDCPFDTINPDCGTCWAHHLPNGELPHHCPECHTKARRARGEYEPWEIAMMEWTTKQRAREAG